MTTIERIDNIRPDEIGRPTGAYRVELLDERGRVTERVDQSNYLTPLALRKLRWQQARQFHRGIRYAHLGAATQQFPASASKRALGAPTRLPIEFIMGLDSNVIENPASAWAPGRVTAFASRWKVGVPAGGPRGQINEQASQTTRSSSKIVFDFNTTQGNGVIRSLAVGRIAQTGSDTQYPAASSVGIGASFFTNNMSLSQLGSSWGFGIAGMDWDASKIYSFDPIAVQIRTFDFSAAKTAGAGEGFADVASLTHEASVVLAGITGTTTTNGTPAYVSDRFLRTGLIKIGTDWVMTYHDYVGGLYIGRWNAAGTQLWVSTLQAAGTVPLDDSSSGVALIGGTLYATSSWNSAQPLSSQSVFPVNATTGAVGAALPLGNNGAGVQLRSRGGICTNGTDLFLNTREGICRMTTAGAIVEWYGAVDMGTYQETGQAPWSANSNWQNMTYPSAPRESEQLYATTTTSSDRLSGNETPEVSTDTAVSGLHMNAAGQMFLISSSGGSAVQRIVSVDGDNCYSRAVLATPVTKTSASTMQLTYEVTFPTEWQAPPTHSVVPT